MRQFHVGDVVIVDETDKGRVPVGIMTDRDIVIEFIAKELALDSVTVGEAMSYELLTAAEEDDMMDTVKQMREQGVRRIPVVDKAGFLQGILTMDDVVDLLEEQIADLVGLIRSEQIRESRQRP